MATDGDWVETKDQDPNGDVRLIQLADVGDGRFLDRSSRFMTMEAARRLRCTFLEQGDLLLARMPDPWAGHVFPRVSLPSGDSRGRFVWRAGRKAADASWLMHVINSPYVRSSLTMLAGGTTRQRVSGGNVKRFELPVPPLAEQRRIVARIEALFARTRRARADLERIAPLAKQFRRRTITSVVGSHTGREYEVREWPTSVTGTTPPTAERRHYGGDLPFIKPTDLDVGYSVAEVESILLPAEQLYPVQCLLVLPC